MSQNSVSTLYQRTRSVVFTPHLTQCCDKVLNMRPSSKSHDLQEATRRTEALSSCLQAAKDFFAAYARISLDSLGMMPLGSTAYLAFAVVTSSRILLLDDSDWEVSLSRLDFDFAAACQNLGDRFEQADCLAQSLGRRRKFDNSVDVSVLSAYRMKIMWIREWYLAKVSAGTRPAADKQLNSMPSTNTAGSPAALSMELHDSLFLSTDFEDVLWSWNPSWGKPWIATLHNDEPGA